jgi:hypothetical protein
MITTGEETWWVPTLERPRGNPRSEQIYIIPSDAHLADAKETRCKPMSCPMMMMMTTTTTRMDGKGKITYLVMTADNFVVPEGQELLLQLDRVHDARAKAVLEPASVHGRHVGFRGLGSSGRLGSLGNLLPNDSRLTLGQILADFTSFHLQLLGGGFGGRLVGGLFLLQVENVRHDE